MGFGEHKRNISSAFSLEYLLFFVQFPFHVRETEPGQTGNNERKKNPNATSGLSSGQLHLTGDMSL